MPLCRRCNAGPDAACALAPCSLPRSRSNTYSALNAVAGHYNNFGTKYPLPAKRAERALKELSDAEVLLTRGR